MRQVAKFGYRYRAELKKKIINTEMNCMNK